VSSKKLPTESNLECQQDVRLNSFCVINDTSPETTLATKRTYEGRSKN